MHVRGRRHRWLRLTLSRTPVRLLFPRSVQLRCALQQPDGSLNGFMKASGGGLEGRRESKTEKRGGVGGPAVPGGPGSADAASRLLPPSLLAPLQRR